MTQLFFLSKCSPDCCKLLVNFLISEKVDSAYFCSFLIPLTEERILGGLYCAVSLTSLASMLSNLLFLLLEHPSLPELSHEYFPPFKTQSECSFFSEVFLLGSTDFMGLSTMNGLACTYHLLHLSPCIAIKCHCASHHENEPFRFLFHVCNSLGRCHV